MIKFIQKLFPDKTNNENEVKSHYPKKPDISAYTIIEQGTTPEKYKEELKRKRDEEDRKILETKFRFSCGECGCVYEIMPKDMTEETIYKKLDNPNGERKTIVDKILFCAYCPNCGKMLEREKYDIYRLVYGVNMFERLKKKEKDKIIMDGEND